MKHRIGQPLHCPRDGALVLSRLASQGFDLRPGRHNGGRSVLD